MNFSERIRGGFGIIGFGLTGVCFAVGFSATSVVARIADDGDKAVELVSARTLVESRPTARAWIEGFEFSPDRIKVSTGTTVLWTNRDGVDHDVTLRDYGVASALVGKGGEIAVAFRKPGEYRYYCHVHPFMQGAVIVQ